jgi:hypothetical protein
MVKVPSLFGVVFVGPIIFKSGGGAWLAIVFCPPD